MFRFANPDYLYLLALIPVFIAIYIFYLYRRKKQLARFGNPQLLRDLMIGVSQTRRHLKFALLMLALALAIFLVARPQYGTRNEEVKRQGIEAIITVDVSNSMLCRDVSPSRLDKSKMLVSKLIEQLDQDRIGLVAFAGSAITLLPVTSDYVSAKMFLDQLSPATIAVQGTNMAEAIQRATAGFTDNKNVGKALILITDAEDHEDGAVEAAKIAHEKGIHLFVLSIGTESGGPIPLGNGSHKKDNHGNIVTTKLNEEVGKQIAKAADGIYMKVDQTDQAQRLLQAEIDKMQKEDITTSMYSEYDEQFVAVAILLLLVLLIEVCIMEKQNEFLNRFRLFKATGMLLVLILFTENMSAQSNDRDYIRLGNSQQRNGQYQRAETSYRKALDQHSSLEAYYNLGNALAYQGKDSTAFEMYKQAVDVPSQNTRKRAHVYHNMGNLVYANGVRDMKTGGQNATQSFQQAVELYKNALRLNPDDNETRYNLAMAQYLLKKSQENQQQNQQQQQQQQQDQQQQQQQQQDQQQKEEDKQQDEQPPQPKKDQIDDKTAEQLLNSAQQDEKDVQRKVQQNPTQRRSLERDW